MSKHDKDLRAEVELLASEYIGEVVAAGGARLMVANDLGEFISELVLNNFDGEERAMLAAFALETAHMLLLPEECRRRGIEVDPETAAKLREALQ